MTKLSKKEIDEFVKLCLNNFSEIKTKEEYVAINCSIDIHKLYFWINSNYIPKNKVDGLKMNYISTLDIRGKQLLEGYNACVDEFNQKINNLIEGVLKK